MRIGDEGQEINPLPQEQPLCGWYDRDGLGLCCHITWLFMKLEIRVALSVATLGT